ncbi:Putative S-adenosyl-L-methionine-dependent methyltransferase ML2640 [Nocardia farcinica]|uniref:S-adenosyl-L-methionine-dependent methyltransferase n=1 Tax=Nocardia farcinica TaxID=37329 RepID=A0A449H9D8_NOCFR|nr:SAM-dependent methyltransferase [Nocardia farcinica]VFA94663.1 Putative S-adenosyl-L-methionine-dependent methyltransferase ML2640 [Nocardia farcinica]
MGTRTPGIRDVSDTARWVAVYRARESERPDALFQDPFAAELAGAAGAGLADPALLPRGARNHWPTVVRTRLIDDLVLRSLAAGCDRVINVAAGLDTRPYRLPVPAATVWYEADLPALLADKDAVLADRRPRCRRVTRALDVTDPAALTGFLAEATADSAHALVLTEGLLPYLTPPQVRAIAAAVHAAPVRGWVFDHWSPAMRYAVNALLGRELGSARWQFAAPLRFFEGWRVDSAQSTFRAAARWRRAPLPFRPWALAPETGLRRRPERSPFWCGVVRMRRADEAV